MIRAIVPYYYDFNYVRQYLKPLIDSESKFDTYSSQLGIRNTRFNVLLLLAGLSRNFKQPNICQYRAIV